MSRNNKKVVLVTGGTGLVGKGIEYFIATGAWVWGYVLCGHETRARFPSSPCATSRARTWPSDAFLARTHLHTQTPRPRRRRSTFS